MLHRATVEPGTFLVLEELLALPELSEFSLVGGTALSLLFGHRKSIDLDLFSSSAFDQKLLINLLQKRFGNDFKNENPKLSFALFCFIHQIKIDLVHYPHPLLKPVQVIEGIRIYSVEDIAAMKIKAILGRGVKKDFWDLAELLNHFSLSQILDFYGSKYPNHSMLISIPNALTYFEDAENSPSPVSLNHMDWSQVKTLIKKRVSDFLR
jgi:hypothetical protein